MISASHTLWANSKGFSVLGKVLKNIVGRLKLLCRQSGASPALIVTESLESEHFVARREVNLIEYAPHYEQCRSAYYFEHLYFI